MFGALSMPELILIFVVALLLFGPRKMPQIGRSIGRAMGEFRRASNEFKRTIEDEVAADESDLSRFHTPSYRRIFYDELPAAMSRLDSDPSPVALARASVTYNMIVEGVLAETGYHVYHSILERHGILPGMLEVVGHLQRDESRHLAYGEEWTARGAEFERARQGGWRDALPGR